MATLEQLVALGKLKKHEPDLEANEQPVRFVYLSPDAAAWAEGPLQTANHIGRNLSPYEQAELVLYNFVKGRPLAYGSGYHPLDPLPKWIWELKTADVRLIGWFARRATFVVACGAFKRNLLKRAHYTPHIEHAVSFRHGLDLDPPKAVTGVSRHAVL